MLKFEHAFEEEPRFGDLSVDKDTPQEAMIEFRVEEDGIWLSANSKGFLHLARIFAELGTRQLEAGYHFHQTGWINLAGGDNFEAVSVELLDG